MKSVSKVLAIALVAVGCSVLTASKASADELIMSSPAIIPDSTVTTYTSPMWISQPSVIESTPVFTSPTVVEPTYVRMHHHHLLRAGVPGLLDFSVF